MKTKQICIAIYSLIALTPAYSAEPDATATAQTSPARWQIFPARTALKQDGQPSVESENTILLDTATGKSWMLWTTTSGYSWVELPMIKEFPANQALPNKPDEPKPVLPDTE